MAKKYSVFVMLHFQASKQRNCKNEHMPSEYACYQKAQQDSRNPGIKPSLMNLCQKETCFFYLPAETNSGTSICLASSSAFYYVPAVSSTHRTEQAIQSFMSLMYFRNGKEWFQDHSFAFKRLVISAPFCLCEGAWIPFSLVLSPWRSILIPAAQNGPP